MANHVEAQKEPSSPLVFILDFDGIITTLDIDWKQAEREVSKNYGIEVNGFLNFFEKNYGSERFTTVSDFLKNVEMNVLEKAKTFPDVTPALQRIQAAKARSYVASMQSQQVLDFFLTKNQLDSFFSNVIGREKAGSKRRELELIAEYEKDVPRNRIIFIDDNRRHLYPCAALGFHCVYFDRKKERRNLFDVVESLIQ